MVIVISHLFVYRITYQVAFFHQHHNKMCLQTSEMSLGLFSYSLALVFNGNWAPTLSSLRQFISTHANDRDRDETSP